MAELGRAHESIEAPEPTHTEKVKQELVGKEKPAAFGGLEKRLVIGGGEGAGSRRLPPIPVRVEGDRRACEA